jgi:hypothetical protein
MVNGSLHISQTITTRTFLKFQEKICKVLYEKSSAKSSRTTANGKMHGAEG